MENQDGDKKLKELTEEQKKSLKKLQRSFALRMVFKGFKFAGLLFLSSLVISAVDVFYVHNKEFTILSTITTFILIFGSFHNSIVSEHDRIREEIKKILES